MIQLFSDGGVVGKNPSPIGGTWSWVLVDDGVLIACDWSFMEPKDFDKPTMSNNVAELYAAVRGLESCPQAEEWLTDSLVTLRRLTKKRAKFGGVPGWLERRARRLRRDNIKTTLLAGHPSKAELKAGVARRNKHPVSRWNVLADQLCHRAKKEFLNL